MKMKKVKYHNRFSQEYILNYCEEHDIKYEWNEDNTISIPWCEVGDNFYNYGENEPKIKVTRHEFLTKSPLVRLTKCEDCDRCADW